MVRCPRPCPRSGVLAEELIEQIFKVRGVPQVCHADRGTSMTGRTVAALLADLEVTRSRRGHGSANDNPCSESLFRTLKYGPEFLECFGSSRRQGSSSTPSPTGHHEHRRTGIGLHTPADVHFGFATDKAADRRRADPSPRPTPAPASAPAARPKILDLPNTVWINPTSPTPTPETDTTRLTPTATHPPEEFQGPAGLCLAWLHLHKIPRNSLMDRLRLRRYAGLPSRWRVPSRRRH